MSNPGAYHAFIGRWSQLVARKFLAWLNVGPNRSWLDVGCGTGALTTEILALASPQRIWGLDPSEERINYAQKACPKAQFEVSNAESLPKDWCDFDVVVSGLALNVMPNPAQALSEIIRVTRPGGLVAAYCWDFVEGMQPLRYLWDALIELDPNAAKVDPAYRYPLSQPEPLQQLFATVGLQSVELQRLEVPTPFKDFDDYWLPLLSGNGKTQRYLAGLEASKRYRVREKLKERLPIQPEGTIHLSVKAWAIRGICSDNSPMWKTSLF
ncbi:MAG: methyltransferase domain-containing protein [Cyanobacteria bacterium P01_D01_bin.44]